MTERMSEQTQGEAAAEAATDPRLPEFELGSPRSGPRKLFIVAAAGAALVTVLLLGLSLFLFLGIENNQFVSRLVRERIISSLQERLDPSLSLSIDDVELKHEEAGVLVRIKGFVLRDKTGQALVSAPAGKISLETWPMLSLRLVPNDVTLEGLRVAVEVSESGKLVISPASEVAAISADDPVEKPTSPVERLQQTITAAFAGFAATRESVGGKLPNLGILDASFAVLDRRTGRRFSFSGINSRLHTASDGATVARTEMKSGGAPFAVEFNVSAPDAANGQVFTANTDRLALGDLLAIAGLSTSAVDLKTPVTMTLRAEVDKSLNARSALAEFHLGKTKVSLDAAKSPPVTIEKTSAILSWSGADTISVDSILLAAGGANIALNGTLVPPPAANLPWKLSLAGAKQTLDGVTAADRGVELTSVAAELSGYADTGRVVLDSFDLAGPNVRLQMSGQLYLEPDGKPAATLDMAVTNTEARTALRLWPVFAAPDVREWLIDSLRSGSADNIRLKLAFTGPVMALALADKPLPEEALTASWNVSRAVLRPVAGAPSIRDIAGVGAATGRMVRIDTTGGFVETSPGHRLLLGDSSFVVADTAPEPADGRVRVKFSGPVETVAEFIRSPGIKPFAPGSVDPALVKGSADGEVSVFLRLAKKPNVTEARVNVAANLKNVTVEKAIGGDKIENANFTVTVERDNALLKGDGKIFGVPANIEVRGGARTKARATITMALDEAARVRKGVNLGSMLTGPVGVKIAADVDGKDDRNIDLELDFSKARIDGLIPGWTKAAGQAARAKFGLDNTDGGGWLLDDIEFDAGAVSVRGNANFGADGQFQKAKLSTFKLSPGDNVHIEADRTSGVLKIDVKGNSFDARPFLRSLQTGAIDKSGGKDTEIALKTTVLSGFNGEIVSNADLKLAMRGSELRRFDLNGKFDRSSVAARLTARPGSQPLLIVESSDAGAFLRYFDIYNRMRGGQLNLSASLASGSQSGVVQVRDFMLRNEPAMKRLVADSATSGISDGARFDPAFVRRLGANQDVAFTKMSVEFSRTASRLDLKDAVMWGPDLGGSISGYLDYLRDRVDLTGIFVPAYTLNNLISKVPVLGPLLAGGVNEGLFAVRYNITGKVSSPTLTFNPLTAIAPGFLRKIIDFRGAQGTPGQNTGVAE